MHYTQVGARLSKLEEPITSPSPSPSPSPYPNPNLNQVCEHLSKLEEPITWAQLRRLDPRRPTSPYISLYLLISPYLTLSCAASTRAGLHLPTSPYISLYLPISP